MLQIGAGMSLSMKVCIIGTGYVGLVTGTCFAETGNIVTCVDVDEAKIKNLKDGIIPIYEPGLDALVKSNLKENRLFFTLDLEAAINQADISFIAVGTPPNEDGSADLSHVLNVAKKIAQIAKKPILLGTKSTVPVGTGEKIEAIFKKDCQQPYTIFSNPEFLKEGDAINDFMKPDRIIIGVNDHHSENILRELYAPFTRQKDRLVFMGRRSAEITKYAANAMLATRISFMNEIANLCEKVGADVGEVRNGLGYDPRIGSAFLFPGIGYGGSCFPKDVKAILKTGQEYGSKLSVIQAVEDANQHQKQVLFSKIAHHFGGEDRLKGKIFALWGLAFKAKTDDIRESPALPLIDDLLRVGATVKAYDPQAMENIKAIYGDKIALKIKNYDCLDNADALLIATDWNEFRSPDYDEIAKRLSSKTIFDGRNILNRSHLKELGFTYYGVGTIY